MTAMLAQSSLPALTENGGATAIGVWVLMAIAVFAGGIFIYNQILTAKVSQKVLNAPVATQQQIAQPLIVAMEKEFVMRRDFDVLSRTVDDNRKEAIEAIRKQSELLTALGEDSQERGEKLAAIEADSKTHTRQLTGIDKSIGDLREDLGFQRGRTEKRV
jgi:glucose-6-phosphate-specific signal transduction histidine kinase